jgi:hypothetical protein
MAMEQQVFRFAQDADPTLPGSPGQNAQADLRDSRGKVTDPAVRNSG